jgi:predicted enzyme related to lactoylglutathione lyase
VISAVGSVPVFVADQSRAVEFYTERLGFVIMLDIPIGHGIRWLTVAPQKGGCEIILFPPEMAGKSADEMRNRIGQWTGIVMMSEDCRKDHADLIERGVSFKTPPEKTLWGGWMAEFFDVDGNRFQLVERPAYMR